MNISNIARDKEKLKELLELSTIDKKKLFSLRIFHGELLKKCRITEDNYSASIYYSMIRLLQNKIDIYESVLNKNDILLDFPSKEITISPSEKKMVDELDPLNDTDIRSVMETAIGGHSELSKTITDLVNVLSDHSVKSNLKTKNSEDLNKCPTVLFIYSPNCIHCKNFYESWNKLVADFDKHIINMLTINGSLEENKFIVDDKKLNLDGFPSLYVINENLIYNYYDEYNKSLNYEDAKKFLDNLI